MHVNQHHQARAPARLLVAVDSGIDPHRLVRLMPGLHPILLRIAGFEDFTVPALELDGRKVQGSRRIARVLDEVRPERPLFPLEPDLRARVEEAERWATMCSSPCRAACFATCCL